MGFPEARALRGRAAVAAARLAYFDYLEWTAGERWQHSASLGTHPQRLLWASTSAKNPAYADIKYVESLSGPQTINTMPQATLDAYRDHGRPASFSHNDLGVSRSVPPALRNIRIDLDAVSRELERDGVRKIVEFFDNLLAALKRRAQKLTAG